MKQLLYKTAFSPMYNCYVALEKAYQDSMGKWIFVGSNEAEDLHGILFRENELKNFVL